MSNTTVDQSESTSLLGVASDFTRTSTTVTVKKHSIKNSLQPTCEFRLIKSRGAILVLILNFFIMVTIAVVLTTENRATNIIIKIIVIGMTVTYPLAGWLADVYIGRYKMLYYCTWIMWIGIMLTTTLVIITKFYENTETVISKVLVPCYIIVIIGLSGFQANIVQFGVDQLIDASSKEIRAFIIWYVWTLASSNCIYEIFSECVPENYSNFSVLYVAISLTCAISVNFLCNNQFVKEPVTVNPIKLVMKVLKYALKTKQPQRRSAFTYWEDKPPSRIDFGKSKYGGPFTNEQVEDVKTFLRMSLGMSLSSIFIGVMKSLTDSESDMMYHFKDSSLNFNSFQHCLTRSSISNLDDCSWVVIVPLYEFIIHPLFCKCIPNVQSLTRFLMGMILLLITVSIQMTLDVVGHSITTYNSNTTVPCMLEAKEDDVTSGQTLDISYKWLIIPNLTRGLASYTTVVAALEFVCAQSPYSMKGMMFGFLYFIDGLSATITTGLIYLVLQKDIHWSPTWLGCGVWYYLLVMVITAVIIILFIFAMKWYKKRDRDDELPNTQTFAINYYERYAGRTH